MKPESNDWSLTTNSVFPNRGGVTWAAVSGSTIELLAQKFDSPLLRTRIVGVPKRSITLNLTLVAAVVMLVIWAVLLFVIQVPAGSIHLLYAGAVILFARRALAGAPRFVS